MANQAERIREETPPPATQEEPREETASHPSPRNLLELAGDDVGSLYRVVFLTQNVGGIGLATRRNGLPRSWLTEDLPDLTSFDEAALQVVFPETEEVVWSTPEKPMLATPIMARTVREVETQIKKTMGLDQLSANFDVPDPTQALRDKLTGLAVSLTQAAAAQPEEAATYASLQTWIQQEILPQLDNPRASNVTPSLGPQPPAAPAAKESSFRSPTHAAATIHNAVEAALLQTAELVALKGVSQKLEENGFDLAGKCRQLKQSYSRYSRQANTPSAAEAQQRFVEIATEISAAVIGAFPKEYSEKPGSGPFTGYPFKGLNTGTLICDGRTGIFKRILAFCDCPIQHGILVYKSPEFPYGDHVFTAVPLSPDEKLLIDNEVSTTILRTQIPGKSFRDSFFEAKAKEKEAVLQDQDGQRLMIIYEGGEPSVWQVYDQEHIWYPIIFLGPSLTSPDSSDFYLNAVIDLFNLARATPDHATRAALLAESERLAKRNTTPESPEPTHLRSLEMIKLEQAKLAPDPLEKEHLLKEALAMANAGLAVNPEEPFLLWGKAVSHHEIAKQAGLEPGKAEAELEHLSHAAKALEACDLEVYWGDQTIFIPSLEKITPELLEIADAFLAQEPSASRRQEFQETIFEKFASVYRAHSRLLKELDKEGGEETFGTKKGPALLESARIANALARMAPTQDEQQRWFKEASSQTAMAFALQSEPENPKLYYRMARDTLGTPLAEVCARRYLEHFPETAPALKLLGDCLKEEMGQSNDPEEVRRLAQLASGYYKKALGYDADQPSIYDSLGFLYCEAGITMDDPIDAASHFRQAIDMNRQAQAIADRVGLANTHKIHSKRLQNLACYCLNLISLEPDPETKQQLLQTAGESLQRARQEDQNNQTVYKELGRYCLLTANAQDSDSAKRQWLQQGLSYYQQAAVYYDENNPEIQKEIARIQTELDS